LYHPTPKVYIERRNGSPRLYVRAFIGGGSRIRTTGEATLGAAVRKAQEIYLDWMIPSTFPSAFESTEEPQMTSVLRRLTIAAVASIYFDA
jgi:hypothetical protein